MCGRRTRVQSRTFRACLISRSSPGLHSLVCAAFCCALVQPIHGGAPFQHRMGQRSGELAVFWLHVPSFGDQRSLLQPAYLVPHSSSLFFPAAWTTQFLSHVPRSCSSFFPAARTTQRSSFVPCVFFHVSAISCWCSPLVGAQHARCAAWG